MSFRFSGFFGTELPACLSSPGIKTLGDAIDATEKAAKKYYRDASTSSISPETVAFVLAMTELPDGQHIFVSPKVRISDARARMAQNILVLAPILEDGVAALTVEGAGIASARILIGRMLPATDTAPARACATKKVADLDELAPGTLFGLPFDIIRCESSPETTLRLLIEIVFSDVSVSRADLSGRHIYVSQADRMKFISDEQIFVYESNRYSILSTRKILDVLQPDDIDTPPSGKMDPSFSSGPYGSGAFSELGDKISP